MNEQAKIVREESHPPAFALIKEMLSILPVKRDKPGTPPPPEMLEFLEDMHKLKASDIDGIVIAMRMKSEVGEPCQGCGKVHEDSQPTQLIQFVYGDEQVVKLLHFLNQSTVG